VNLKEGAICIIENPLVTRDDFRTSLVRGLTTKGVSVRVVAMGQSSDDCHALLNYTATWASDLGTRYVQTAQATIHEDGVLKGSAIYDSSQGGLNLSKWVQSDENAAEFIQKLFPQGPVVWPTPSPK
jgi:hypothetical protein